MNKAELGSVSHGTLKIDDLLEAFAGELESHVQDNAEEWCSDAGRVQRDALVKLVWDAREIVPHADPDIADELVTELIEALCTFAPDGAYFGAHPGDGADFGFWPNEEAEQCPDCGALIGHYTTCPAVL